MAASRTFDFVMIIGLSFQEDLVCEAVNKKPDAPFDKAMAIRSFLSNFGNPAIPKGPVAFRPTIARSLALSVILFF
jgi:hypothetical protein